MKCLRIINTIVIGLLLFTLFSCASSRGEPEQVVPKVIKSTAAPIITPYTETRTDVLVAPVFQTGRTGFLSGDADDPAVWIHPTDPSRSVIFGTDKVDGFWAWDFTGKELVAVDPWGKTGNIDVRYGLEMGDGKVDIVAVNLRKIKYEEGSKLAVYAINPDYTSGDDLLTVLADGQSENNDVQKGTYGFGLYQNPETGLTYAFESAAVGPIRQYLIEDDGSGERIKLTAVRDLVYDRKQCEGMVADDQLGFFYVGEEDTAIHKYYADPDASPEMILTFATMDDGYNRDREGLALYNCPDGTGYLLVVDQGEASEKVPSILRIYEREGDNKLVKTVAHLDMEGNPMWDDDGVDASSSPILPLFPNGFVIGHDGDHSTYTVYDWRDFAGDDLTICGE